MKIKWIKFLEKVIVKLVHERGMWKWPKKTKGKALVGKGKAYLKVCLRESSGIFQKLKGQCTIAAYCEKTAGCFKGGYCPRLKACWNTCIPEAMARSTAPAVMVSVPREATSGCLLSLWKARPKPPTQELISGILTHLQLLLHSGPLSPFIWKFHMVPPAQSCASLHLKCLTEVSLNQFC